MVKIKKVICFGCGRNLEIRDTDPEFFCSVCGACNVVPQGESSELPLNCVAPKGFEWELPAGKLQSIAGKAIYITAQGSHVDKETFKRMYKCDPEIVYQNMRKNGITDIKGYKNLSIFGRRGKK